MQRSKNSSIIEKDLSICRAQISSLQYTNIIATLHIIIKFFCVHAFDLIQILASSRV